MYIMGDLFIMRDLFVLNPASHTTYVVCVHFMHGGTYSIKSKSGRLIVEKLLFVPEICRKEFVEDIFFLVRITILLFVLFLGATNEIYCLMPTSGNRKVLEEIFLYPTPATTKWKKRPQKISSAIVRSLGTWEKGFLNNENWGIKRRRFKKTAGMLVDSQGRRKW